jgi:hypothetical protein
MALTGARVNETFFTIYYVIAKKSRVNNKRDFKLNNIEINPFFWKDCYLSPGRSGKLEDALNKLEIYNELKSLKTDIDILGKKSAIDIYNFFETRKWDDALKQQTINFSKNPKTAFIRNNKLVFLRGSEFLKISNLTQFLQKFKQIYFGSSASYKDERWNPSDLWFYNQNSLEEIQGYISQTSVMKNDIKNKEIIKNLALEDIDGLNQLIFKLYKDKSLAPISLKKPDTGSFGSSTLNISLINSPEKPYRYKKSPEKITNIKNSIDSNEYKINDKLSFDIEVEHILLTETGKKVSKKIIDKVFYDNKANAFKSQTKGTPAAAGQTGKKLIEKIVYNSKSLKKLIDIRKSTIKNNFNKKDIISSVDSINPLLGVTKRSKINPSYDYLQKLAEDVDPSLINKEMNFNTNRQDVYKNAQDKLEINFAIDNAGTKKEQDEIRINLWESCTSRGIVDRKEYEKMVTRIGARLHKKSRKKGQQNMTIQEAENLAKDLMRARNVNPTRIPSSFHIKLY